MWRRKPDRLLEEMIRDNDFAGQEADDMSGPSRAELFDAEQKADRVTAEQTARRRDRRSGRVRDSASGGSIVWPSG